MNISHKHKIIWFAPEKTATKLISTILQDFNFEFHPDNKKLANFYSNEKFYCSNEIKFHKKYKNYKILMSVRNPYDRIVSIFLNYGVSTKIGITKYNKDKLKIYVRDFFYNLLNFEYGKDNYVGPFLKKWELSNFKPDYFVRIENLYEDLNKLDFISSSESWVNGDYLPLLSKKDIKNYHFTDFYNIETAKMIYEFYKTHFLYFDYDPFSFTNEELTNEQKISFIHDIF